MGIVLTQFLKGPYSPFSPYIRIDTHMYLYGIYVCTYIYIYLSIYVSFYAYKPESAPRVPHQKLPTLRNLFSKLPLLSSQDALPTARAKHRASHGIGSGIGWAQRNFMGSPCTCLGCMVFCRAQGLLRALCSEVAPPPHTHQENVAACLFPPSCTWDRGASWWSW